MPTDVMLEKHEATYTMTALSGSSLHLFYNIMIFTQHVIVTHVKKHIPSQ